MRSQRVERSMRSQPVDCAIDHALNVVNCAIDTLKWLG
jgi:hypothetical protein